MSSRTWLHLRSGAARSTSVDGRLAPLLALALLGLAVSGCAAFSSSGSVSDSSGSVSDSVGSSSDSSDSSSGGDDSAYRSEVTEYVVAAVEQSVPPADLRRGVTEIALAHGIADWEAVPATFAAVEEGLAGAEAVDRARYRDAFGLADDRSRDDGDVAR